MTERNRFIDILKGILAVFVILLHSSINPDTRLVLGFPFWANMAVPGFMFLSGYVGTKSFYSKNIKTFKGMYAHKGLFARFIRLIIPFSIAYILEWIVFRIFGIYMVNIVVYGLRAAFFDYLRGGIGQGSYYFPIMIQFVFLLPIIVLIVGKFKEWGLAGMFVANALWELLKNAVGMSDYTYRFIIFRYLFIIAAGVYFAIFNHVKSKYSGIIYFFMIIIGLFTTTIFSYTDYSPKLVNMWKTTSFVTVLYLVPLFEYLTSDKFKNVKCSLLELAGKASFNIFLVQMIYYNFAEKMLELVKYNWLFVLISVINCVAAGIVFYLLESAFTKKVIAVVKGRT